MEWAPHLRRLGMRDLAPGRISEVELWKHLGDRQWQRIADHIGQAPAELVSEDGERLYATFATAELRFPPACPLHAFGEGVWMGERHSVRAYARRFIEGLVLMGRGAVPELPAAGITSRADLEALEQPWAVLTNTFVARPGGNSRLVVREPVGMEGWTGPILPALPPDLADQQRVAGEGPIEPPPARAIPLGKPFTERAPVEPETDLNGAGLLYFARYVGIFDRSMRIFLSEGLFRPVSANLLDCLLTRRRRVYYYANAEPTDTLRVVGRVWLSPPSAPRRSFGRDERFTLHGQLDLYRDGDRVWMATTVVDKVLAIPEADRSLRLEADRILKDIGVTQVHTGFGP